MIRPDYSPIMHKLPGPLRLTPSFPFAGRSRELATLRGLIPAPDGDGLRFALVGGEAGSGKSRLVREFAQEADAAGAFVLYGACDAVVQRPYRPFVEALDQLARVADPAELRADLGEGGGELSRLLPDLSQRVGGLAVPAAADPDTERHRLHSAISDLLTAVSRRTPLVVIVEDAHWADPPTLLLLRHLARGAPDAHGLVLTTFRDTEAEIPETLSSALADLRRTEGVVRVRLAGLSAEEIAEFVDLAGDRDPRAEQGEVARSLRELTGGNAFLMTELWRTLVDSEARWEGGWPDGTLADLRSPEGVREVVGQRLARLDTATIDVLELAAVAGHEFDLSIVGRAGPALEQAVAHGMIEEVPSRQLAFQFTHELVRRALYDRMPGLRRAELHLRVGEALERDAGDRPRVADLAYHFAAAAPIDGPERAVEYALLAGREAIATLAYDEAEARFAAALSLGMTDPRRVAETQLELGTACSRGGRSERAIAAYRAAADLARDLDDAELLATAAVGFEEACWRPAIVDQGAIELLWEASDALPEDDSTLRVKVLAGLARALDFVGASEDSSPVREAAEAMARRLDDRQGLAKVLVRSYWSRDVREFAQTLDMLAEARDLAHGVGDDELEIDAREWRVAGLIAIGDLDRAHEEHDEVISIAHRLRQPFPMHVAEHYASTLALCDGRLADAEASAHRSHEWARLLTGRPPSGIHGIQMFSIRREQDRLDELSAVMRLLVGGDAPGGAWRPGLAALLAELGLEAETRRELADIRREGFDALRASLWLASLTYLADACSAVGDAELAGLLYPELAPLAGGNVAIGHGVVCYGAADRYLGLLAATLGEHDLAADHFEEALTLNRRMHAPTWVANTLLAYGRTLQSRGRSADIRAASALLSDAVTLAEATGLPMVLHRARELGGDAARRAPLPDDLSSREVDVLRLVATGRSNREIGAELFISGHTVANHMRSILRKTGAANRTEAAGYAYRHSLLDPGDPR